VKLGVLTAFRGEHKHYVQACEKLNVDYEVIDIIGDDWMAQISNSDCDGFLCRTPSKFQERKNMFTDKLHIITEYFKKPIYPTFNELFIHENKMMMYYFARLSGLPHVETHVFYRKEEYLEFVEKHPFPFVFKTSIGATSKGVEIIRSRAKARKIGRKIFGLINSKLAKGYTPQTTGKIIPFPARGLNQKHFVLVQEFKQIKWEWRIVKIGDSYFGHRKLLKGEFASGSHIKGWGKPPEQLLDYARKISDNYGFYSVALDIFETVENEYFVNEIQSIFDQPVEHLMIVDDQPGRYLYKDGQYVFEAGNFNEFKSYLLRVKHFIEILKEKGVK